MHEKSAQSLMDVLIRLMPELAAIRKGKTDPKLANLLYNEIWSKEANRVNDKTFRRPTSVKSAEIDKLKGEGLVEVTGDNISITAKGTQVIKQMILGDDRSIFEDDGRPTDYIKAMAGLKSTRMSKKAKRASSDGQRPSGASWYSKMSDGLPCAECCRRKV